MWEDLPDEVKALAQLPAAEAVKKAWEMGCNFKAEVGDWVDDIIEEMENGMVGAADGIMSAFCRGTGYRFLNKLGD